MIEHLPFVALVFTASTLFALLEIQIEGAQGGWAWNLPTWRKDSRLARLLLGGRTLTGYHLYVHLFVLTVAHSAYGLGLPFSWAAEARIVAFLILFWVGEDFLWFILNPAFGLRRFRPEHIPWHRRSWWGIMPREYWIGIPVGIAFYVLGA